MNELRPLVVYEKVLEFSGGGAPTRYVLSHYRLMIPSGENWEWIQHYEGYNDDEARKFDQAGRWFTIHEDGAVLIVNGQPVGMVGGSRGMTNVKDILALLKP